MASMASMAIRMPTSITDKLMPVPVHVFGDVDFVDNQQIGFGDARAAFAGDFVAGRFMEEPTETGTLHTT
jgi:hypothetical protein